MGTIPGLESLWAQTRGDPRVSIAVLDGPVDRNHPSLWDADLTTLELVASATASNDPASRHGTQVASVIFGQPNGPVAGIAPRCRGMIVPVFESPDGRSLHPCSQLDLARAIAEATRYGAQVINLSGGELSASSGASPILAETVRRCLDRDVLIVAAAGNPGTMDPQLPAALPGVLAVGATAADGTVLSQGNWEDLYEPEGVLAPGERIPGALPGGGVAPATGTSYAAAIVSGIAALIWSLLLKRGEKPSANRVREAIRFAAAEGAFLPTANGHRRFRFDVQRAVSFLTQGNCTMSQVSESASTQMVPSLPAPAPAPADVPKVAEARPGGCGCAACSGATRLVYALGRIGYDLIGEARLDSLAQHISAHAGQAPDRGLAFDARRVMAYLDDNPWDAAALEWTLVADGTPLYAIRPQGPFAGEAYRRLREFFVQQDTDGVERVSVPGRLSGKATLLMGQVVPVIVPELRGMYSWTTTALVKAVIGPAPGRGGNRREEYERKRKGVTSFLDRVYHELRNLGVLSPERAMNYAATNAFQVGGVYAAALEEGLELDTIKATPSPVCRPGSDCWDIEVYFFYPERQVQTVRKVYRFTVDVSDVVPVSVGVVQSWYTR